MLLASSLDTIDEKLYHQHFLYFVGLRDGDLARQQVFTTNVLRRVFGSEKKFGGERVMSSSGPRVIIMIPFTRIAGGCCSGSTPRDGSNRRVISSIFCLIKPLAMCVRPLCTIHLLFPHDHVQDMPGACSGACSSACSKCGRTRSTCTQGPPGREVVGEPAMHIDRHNLGETQPTRTPILVITKRFGPHFRAFSHPCLMPVEHFRSGRVSLPAPVVPERPSDLTPASWSAVIPSLEREGSLLIC